jgi:hypothetical protein
MLMHNESGKWLKWSERMARTELRTNPLVIHTFPSCRLQCIWWA